MEKNENKGAHNPREGANPLSIITFTWLFRTFNTGFKRELEIKDLYSPLKEHSSQFLGDKLSRLWNKEVEKFQKLNNECKPSLLKVLTKCFGCKTMIFGLCLGLFEFVVRTTQPIVLANLLRYFSASDDITQIDAFYWGTGIIIGLILDCFMCNAAYQGLTHIGMKIRVGCCSLIYRKILKVSKAASDDQTSVGQMVNLFSNDVNRLDYSMYFLHYLWIAPIQTAIISYLLYREVDLAAAGGIITLLIFIPIHGCYGKLTSHLTTKMAYRTDERLRLINEIISAIKVIKIYTWEKPFSYLMDKARAKEVKVIRNNLMAFEMAYSFETYIPRICVFITILGYILFGNDVDAKKVYLITAYYNVLRTTLYRYFTLSIKQYAEALVSVKRLQKFLLLEEIEYKSESNNDCDNLKPQEDTVLSFKNVTAQWCTESKTESLKQITFRVKSNSITAIIGKVGSGKTTLLHAILKEIPIKSGEMQINGKISYASQESWLFASTIKQNILFGQPFDKDRYEKVIDVCQLKRDLQLLSYGDNTLVGEKGINLSGGQCARVNLARAVYHKADIYLLDDPLSAVDTHVGRGIFEDCIKTFLKYKTVILVTHQFHFLKHVDQIVILEDGSIQEQGTYSELIKSEQDLTKMMQLDIESNEVLERVQSPAKKIGKIIESSVPCEEEDEHEESRTVGRITAKTYLQYLSAARSGFLIFLVLLISVGCHVCATGADYFVTYWVNQEETSGNFTANNLDDPFRGRTWYIAIYGSISILTAFVTLSQAHAFYHMSMRISRNLHASMFNSVINTTMAFFNANPIGRIMNRFSKDMGIADTQIPPAIIDVTQSGLYTIAVIIVVASVSPWFLIPAFIIGLMAYYFRNYYIKTSRSIKRLEGITRSPVFNHLSASVRGLTTIRALNAQNILIREFDNHQDLHSSAWFIFFSGAKAFGIYIELMCSVFIGVVTYTLISVNDVALAGDVGLVITQCMLLTGVLQWGIRQTTEVENYMTSVERILEYTKLPQEPVLVNKPDDAVPKEWPQKGRVVFKNVSLTYDNQEKPALKNLNFSIEPKEKIGIVGRTGAGKSSIINALFRLADLEGEIYIDNIGTSKVPLQQLRSTISIIPQEPVLFAGTLRRNLDPFEEFLDADLWRALEDVELKGVLDSDLGLNMRVMEGGTNFSVGQRQLLCLARAIVRNNKILVLDEATANIDPKTDELIQEAVRRKFKDCTVLIIAHRLNTVVDSNKILVMDAGQIMEYDHAYKLLQEKDGVFFNMVQQTGSAMAENLLEIAKSSYESRTT